LHYFVANTYSYRQYMLTEMSDVGVKYSPSQRKDADVRSPEEEIEEEFGRRHLLLCELGESHPEGC
jgi:hypothetical protein